MFKTSFREYQVSPAEAESLRAKKDSLQTDLAILEQRLEEASTRGEKIRIGKEVRAMSKRLGEIYEQLKAAPPRPLKPQVALERMLEQLAEPVAVYEDKRSTFTLGKFGEAAERVEWGIADLLRKEWLAIEIQKILRNFASKEQTPAALYALWVEWLENLQREEFDFYPHSTSAWANLIRLELAKAAQDFRRYGAGYLASSLQYQMEQVEVWQALQ